MRAGRVAALMVGIALVAASAACDTNHAEVPTPDTIDFTPVAVVAVDGASLTCRPSPACDHLEAGDVVSVTNEGGATTRLRSDDFDSGVLQPGDSVTWVVSTGTQTLAPVDAPDVSLTLTITPSGGKG